MMNSHPKAIIFDLFGTLIHFTRNTRPYLTLCRAIDSQSLIRKSLTVDAPKLADFCDFLGKNHPSNLASLQDELDQDVAAVRPFPEAMDVLKAVRQCGIRIAVISNLSSPYKEPYFRHGLCDLVDVSIFSCDVGLAKPDERIYQTAMDALGLSQNQVWMVGDSRRCDVDGPAQLGIRGLLLDRSRDPREGDCLRSLADVLPLVE